MGERDPPLVLNGGHGSGGDDRAVGDHDENAYESGKEGEDGNAGRPKSRFRYLPVGTAIFIIVSLFISYGVSVSHGHVEPDFPYISYTAVQIPERCIFAQLINMGACLMAANVYVRFLQQWEMYKGGSKTVRRQVIASLICGFLSALGLSMVANFQTIVMRPPHYVGAALAFGCGLTYCWLQTAISLRHTSRGDRITIVQLVMSICLTSFLIIFIISKTIFKVRERRGEGTKEEELRGVYLVSTVSEWLTVIAVVLFALTFCPDFSTMTFQGPKVRLPAGRVHRQGQASSPQDENSIPLNSIVTNHENRVTPLDN